MKQGDYDDLSGLSMLELFRVEVENQTAILTSGALELEHGSTGPQQIETLLRAAHSLKGASRIVNLQIAEHLAHAMEDYFVAAQQGQIQLRKTEIDVLLRGVDLLLDLSKCNEADIVTWENVHTAEVQQFLDSITSILAGHPVASQASRAPRTVAGRSTPAHRKKTGETPPERETTDGSVAAESQALPATAPKHETPERVLRLNAENLNRLLGLAGESLVESRWLRPFSDSMQRLRRMQTDLSRSYEGLRQTLEEEKLSDRAESQLSELSLQMNENLQFMTQRLQELDRYDRRSSHLSSRLYLEVLRARMRPFADGVRRFPRMVRDLARSLGKEVKLEIIGENTQVDRDILERLQTPLAHLLRNAVDHGCETPGERRRAGKPAEGTVRLNARHSAGMLLVTVSDDGVGVNSESVRDLIVQKKLTTPALAEKLTETELIEFLFLPGFTMKERVTEISGRGVGLDVVQNMIKSVRGAVHVSTRPGYGMTVQLQLPLTLSVLRSLLVEIAGEPYALPLTQIVHTLKLPREKIESLEGRHHFNLSDQRVGLLTAHQVLDCGEPKPPGHDLPVVVLGDRNARYGLIVDRFLGERELVVQPLDPRLGKVQDINAAALSEDGLPVLIVDVDDLLRSIEKLIAGGTLVNVGRQAIGPTARRRKRILAVDDSLTVRELERKLLTSRGYLADVAVDGMDAWSAVRSGHYDLVVTDVDMPRMDGIELAALIKKDPQLKSVPVMIVSYKDREEDRLRGLEAGADYYLTKGSFHDETLLQVIMDLIGEPEE